MSCEVVGRFGREHAHEGGPGRTAAAYFLLGWQPGLPMRAQASSQQSQPPKQRQPQASPDSSSPQWQAAIQQRPPPQLQPIAAPTMAIAQRQAPLMQRRYHFRPHCYSVPEMAMGGLVPMGLTLKPSVPLQTSGMQVARRQWTTPSGYNLVLPAIRVPGHPVVPLQLATDSWMLIRNATCQVMGSVAAAMPRTFHCPFCLENVPEEEQVVLSSCGKKDHRVCRECMGHYIRGLVVDGRANRIGCHVCGGQATSEEILALTDLETHKKFIRFREMGQDPTLRECPSCGYLCRPSLDEGGNVNAEMFCSECNSSFCYYHSNAHSGRPCSEYRREMARQERLNRRGAMHGTKVCPACGIITEKTGGCNHMTCQRCTADWCWSCGEKLDNGQAAVHEHYHAGGHRGCRQFEDFDPHTPLAFLLRCLAVPVRLISVVLFLLLGITILVWLPVAFICLVPCHRCSLRPECRECVLLCALNLAFSPFAAFQLCWILCSVVLWLLMKPCGAACGHLVFLMQVPFVSILPLIAGALRLRGRHGRGAAWGQPEEDWDDDLEARTLAAHESSSSDEEDGEAE